MSATPIRQVNSQQCASIRQLLSANLQNWVNEAIGNSVPVIVRDLVAADLIGGSLPSLYNQVAGLGNGASAAFVGILGSSPGIVTGGTYSAGVVSGPTFSALPNNQAMGLWGCADFTPTPSLSTLQFLVSTSQTFDQISLEYAYASGEPAVIIEPPIIWKPLEYPNIKGNFNSTNAAGVEQICFLGAVCEPSGKTIVPRELPISR